MVIFSLSWNSYLVFILYAKIDFFLLTTWKTAIEVISITVLLFFFCFHSTWISIAILIFYFLFIFMLFHLEDSLHNTNMHAFVIRFFIFLYLLWSTCMIEFLFQNCFASSVDDENNAFFLPFSLSLSLFPLCWFAWTIEFMNIMHILW